MVEYTLSPHEALSLTPRIQNQETKAEAEHFIDCSNLHKLKLTIYLYHCGDIVETKCDQALKAAAYTIVFMRSRSHTKL